MRMLWTSSAYLASARLRQRLQVPLEFRDKHALLASSTEMAVDFFHYFTHELAPPSTESLIKTKEKVGCTSVAWPLRYVNLMRGMFWLTRREGPHQSIKSVEDISYLYPWYGLAHWWFDEQVERLTCTFRKKEQIQVQTEWVVLELEDEKRLRPAFWPQATTEW
jgi:hypothetical protein